MVKGALVAISLEGVMTQRCEDSSDTQTCNFVIGNLGLDFLVPCHDRGTDRDLPGSRQSVDQAVAFSPIKYIVACAARQYRRSRCLPRSTS